MNKIKYLLIILFIFLYANNVYAEEIESGLNSKYKAVLEDDAGLFTEIEKNKLKDQMTSLTEFGNIAVKTINENNYYSTDSYADNYYHKNFNKESGTLLLIDMKYRNIYIFSDGDNYKVITKDKAYIITDNIYKYATNGNYFECAKEALIEINTLLNGGKILEPMRYISNAILSLTISAFFTFGLGIFLTKIKVPSNKSLLKNCDVDFRVNEINVTKIGSHSVYSPRSESSSSFGGSSGGGSSGGGGGGGSSGGGGGHSF